jgi:phosphotransferase system  glucose/maltose/N-acetylglucosamine-specific IIC component
MLAKLEDIFMKLCTPAQLYVIMAVSGALGAMTKSPLNAIGGLIGSLAWAMAINYLCQSGHTDVAWGLVFMPFILLVIAIVAMIVFVVTLPSDKAKAKQSGGAEHHQAARIP